MISDKIRWGILGCGKIASKFASDLKLVDDALLMAVASRDQKKRETFTRNYGASFSFDTYEALASSNQVDVIYVATPHGFHYEHVMLCLRHKKAVLCEKALALNLRQATEMIELAQQQGVFLMEAFWTKFLPQYKVITELIPAGEIGEVKMIQADFGFRAAVPLAQRLYDPALGGGSLLDIGIYPVFLAISILGKPVEVRATMKPFDTGVDEQCAITFKFANGEIASLYSTFAADTPVAAVISGTTGRIHMRNRFHNVTATLALVRKDESPNELPVHREEGFGYQFEARHVGECLRQGLMESPVMRHRDSLLLMETLDRIRNACGVKYDVD